MGTATPQSGGGEGVVTLPVHPILAWHAAFWFLLLMTTMFVWIFSEGQGNWLGLVPTLVALGVAYHFIGRHAADTGDRRASNLYSAILAVCCGLATWFVPLAAFLLMVGMPQSWHLHRTFWRSLFWSSTVLAAVVVGSLSSRGFTPSNVWSMAPWVGITLIVTIGIGVSIDRVVRQSEERAELITELTRTRAELARAHHSAGVAAERERVAREIHDTLAQGFTSIVMLTQNMRADGDADLRLLALIEETARENLAEARALVAAFTPVGLDGGTLTRALERLADRFTRETGLRVEVHCEADGPVTLLTPPQQVVVLRAAQEALANVRKHADASNVQLALTITDDGSIALSVVDDGRGFEPGRSAANGFGLDGMRGRVEGIGGTMAVTTAPGHGVDLRVLLPPAQEPA